MIKGIWSQMRNHGHHPQCGFMMDTVADCDCGFESMYRLIQNESALNRIEKVHRDDGRVICDIIDRLESARAKHPFPTFAALVEEVGEVAMDINEGNNTRNELIDVATVAIRLCNESWG